MLNRLLTAIQIKGPTADKAREALERLLASGQASASVYFALGLDAWQRGKADEARMHLERADELAPQTPAIANNLTWVLASSEPADLPKALELSNLAVERAPRDLNFRDMRSLCRWTSIRCQRGWNTGSSWVSARTLTTLAVRSASSRRPGVTKTAKTWQVSRWITRFPPGTT